MQFRHLIHQNTPNAVLNSSTYPVDIVANGNITQSGLITVDSTVLQAGWKVLCTSQTNATLNGVWIAGSGAWTRDPNFDNSNDWRPGLDFHIQRGASNKNKISQYISPFNPTTYAIQNAVLGTSNIQLVKTNTATYNYEVYNYKYKGKVSGYVNNTSATSNTANVFIMNQTYRRFAKLKNIKLNCLFYDWAATTNRIEVALVPIHQKWGYFHTIDEVRTTFRTNTWNPTDAAGTNGIILLGTVIPTSTTERTMFDVAVPDLVRDIYALRLRLYDTTATDTFASFSSEIYMISELR